MKSIGPEKLGLTFRVLITLAAIFIILTFPESLERGPINALTSSFYILLSSFAIQGFLVLWWGRANVRTWYGLFLKWVATTALVLAILLTLTYAATGTPFNLAGFEIRPLEDLVGVHSVQGILALIMILWAFLVALTGFFAAALTGGIWLVAETLERFLPDLLIDFRKLGFDRQDPWSRRIAAWLLSMPRVLEPSTLRLDLQPLEERMSRKRLLEAVGWQMILGMVLGIYVSLNPALLSILPFAQTYALVSIPVGLIPLLILPILTLEALGAKVPGPRSDFFLHSGGRSRVLQVSLALGGLVWIIWWSASKVGAEIIMETFAIYAILLLLFSFLVSFIYFHFFEASMVDKIRSQLDEKGFLFRSS